MVLRALGHIGFWAGLYVAGAFIFGAQVSGFATLLPPLPAMLAVLLMATAAYALDRVKLRDRWIDPADVMAQPERFAFLQPRARAVRALAFCMLLAGASLGSLYTPWAIAAALAVPIGVAAYAPLPRNGSKRPRLKDRLWLKNAYVAAGITAFAALATVATTAPGSSPSEMLETARAKGAAVAWASILLFLRTVIDAALCDIDDEPTDRQFGTSTLATTLGARRLWTWAAFARAGLTIATLLAMPCPWPARVAWAIATGAGTVALRLRPPRRVRDWVDARFLLEGVVATLVLLAFEFGSR